MKIFFLCCGILFLSFSLSAKTLSYTATGAGMHLLDANITYDEPNPHYGIQMKSQTRGLLSFLVGGGAEFISKGIYQYNQWKIITSQTKTTDGKKVKKRVLDFSDKSNTLDYPALFLDVLMQGEPTTRQYTVFDGRRTMNILFSYQGTVQSETLDMPSGTLLDYYTVSVEIISGKKRGWFFNRMSNKEDSPLHLYFKSNGKDKLSSLVYAAFDTSILGQIVIRLTGES